MSPVRRPHGAEEIAVDPSREPRHDAQVHEGTTRRTRKPIASAEQWTLAFDLPPGLAALPPGVHVLGRDATCDVRVDHASVSRRHARLEVSAGGVRVEDLGSVNGTAAEGRRIGGARDLQDGALLEFGSVLAILRGPARRTASTRGPGSAMGPIHVLADRVAAGSIPVTITGETGAGKEVLAERIHRNSPRRARPLVRLNCAAVPEALMESELFGHERGAFTGAQRAKVGLLEVADGGTLLLDEVGDLPESIQVKLLRALDRREVLRVGAVQGRPMDVRIVAATNRDLPALQAAGRFRADLYYRICGVLIEVPPLRERKDEILALARGFAADSAASLGRRAPVLASEACDRLLAYPWPGNVRELRHVMEAGVLVSENGTIGPEHLPSRVRGIASPAVPATLQAELDEIERRRIIAALGRAGGNQSAAARTLGIPRRTLVKRIAAYGLPRPRSG